MAHPAPAAPPSPHHAAPADQLEPGVEPSIGWHVSHFFYRFDRAALDGMTAEERNAAVAEATTVLDPAAPTAPARLQSWLVAGQKADFAVVALDPSPLAVEGLQQRLLAGPLGRAIVPAASFVSLTEVSEYLPSVEQFGERLVAEGLDPTSDAYAAKMRGYAAREPAMRQARLEPELPAWPNACFYPMNKKRKVGENWFSLPFAERSRLMAEHAKSGMAFAGRVSQVITVAVGLDDWEWGVTLWARRPDYLKEIVYAMRFDEASARYAEFGPFYTGYAMPPAEIFRHCQVAAG